MLRHCRGVMVEEDRVENKDQEAYHSLWEMLKDPVRYTVRSRSLGDLETHDGILKFVRGG